MQLLGRLQYSEAEVLAFENYKVGQKNLNKTSLAWAAVNLYLGIIYINKEDLKNAEKLLIISQEVSKEKGVSGRELLNSSLLQLAIIYKKQHLYKKSETTFKRALILQEEISGKESVEALNIKSNLAGFYYQIGKRDDAIRIAEDVYKGFKDKLGNNHSLTARSRGNLATYSSDKNDYVRTKKMLLETLTFHENSKPIRKDLIWATLNNLATLFVNTGELKLSEEYLLKSLKVGKEVFGSKHRQFAATLMNLGTVSMDLNKDEKAIEYYQKALKILKHTDANLDIIYNNLAMLSQKKSNYTNAEKYFLMSLDWNKTKFNGEHPNTAATLNNLGFLYANQNQNEKAIKYYKKAITLLEKVSVNNRPKIISTLWNLAGVYKTMNDKAKFDEVVKKINNLKNNN